MTRTSRIANQRCPHCGYHIALATAATNAVPKPGDITLCLQCMEVFVLDGELRMRRASKKQLREIMNGPRSEFIVRAQNIARFITRKYG